MSACSALWALTFAELPHAKAEAGIRPPGGKPPPPVLRVGLREATRIRQKIDKEENPDTKTFEPKLIASQKCADFRHPNRSAWLLLFAVAENGPRAHTPVSQLLLIASVDHRIIFEAPSRHPSIQESEMDSTAEQADDALMVEVSPGHFALALSWGGQSKIAGEVSILALSRNHAPKPLWDFSGNRVASIVYFVKLPSEKATALAVRQEEEVYENEQWKNHEHELLFHLDPDSNQYTQVEIRPDHLSKIISVAERNPKSLKIQQEGSVGVESPPHSWPTKWNQHFWAH